MHCVSRFFLVAAAWVGLFGAAHAQSFDAPTTDWSGPYAGASVGYAWADIENTHNITETDGTVFGFGRVLVPPQQFAGPDQKGSADGWFGGLQAGYQQQWDRLVVGVEADIQWTGGDNDNGFSGPLIGPTYRTTAEIEYFGTVRARAGYAIGNILLFGTGGIAYGEAKGTVVVTPGLPGTPTGPSYSGSDSAFHVGYVVGGGLEVALSRTLSAKVEFLHVDLGDETYRFDFAGSGGSFARTKTEIDVDTVKLGLNYHF